MGNIVVHDVKVKWLVDVIALLMACCDFFSFRANNHFINIKKRKKEKRERENNQNG